MWTLSETENSQQKVVSLKLNRIKDGHFDDTNNIPESQGIFATPTTAIISQLRILSTQSDSENKEQVSIQIHDFMSLNENISQPINGNIEGKRSELIMMSDNKLCENESIGEYRIDIVMSMFPGHHMANIVS